MQNRTSGRRELNPAFLYSRRMSRPAVFIASPVTYPSLVSIFSQVRLISVLGSKDWLYSRTIELRFLHWIGIVWDINQTRHYPSGWTFWSLIIKLGKTWMLLSHILSEILEKLASLRFFTISTALTLYPFSAKKKKKWNLKIIYGICKFISFEISVLSQSHETSGSIYKDTEL